MQVRAGQRSTCGSKKCVLPRSACATNTPSTSSRPIGLLGDSWVSGLGAKHYPLVNLSHCWVFVYPYTNQILSSSLGKRYKCSIVGMERVPYSDATEFYLVFLVRSLAQPKWSALNKCVRYSGKLCTSIKQLDWYLRAPRAQQLDLTWHKCWQSELFSKMLASFFASSPGIEGASYFCTASAPEKGWSELFFKPIYRDFG